MLKAGGDVSGVAVMATLEKVRHIIFYISPHGKIFFLCHRLLSDTEQLSIS